MLLALVAACGADPTATTPALRRLELAHRTRVVTIHQQISVDVWAYGPSLLRVPAPALDWTSSDPAIASVDQTGLITGHRLGRVNITATGGGKEASIEISVRAAAVRVTLLAGAPDLLAGESTILDAQLVDGSGHAAPGEGTITWSTFDLGVVRLQAIPGNPNRVEVIALSPGLARLSAGSDGVQGGFIAAVLTERTSNPPIQVRDFHIVQEPDEGALWMQPFLRVHVAPGRVVDLVRIEVVVASAQPSYPSLCSSTRIQPGSHGLLGFGSYPANANLYLHFYEPPVITHGAALLTYREGGVARTAVFRETDNAWDYDFVYDQRIAWQSC